MRLRRATFFFQHNQRRHIDTIIFLRSGNIPLEFIGEIIFDQTTSNGKKNCTRYHKLQLARTSDPKKYVAAIAFRTLRDGDYDYNWAKVGSAEEIAAWVSSFDPNGVLLGFPVGEKFDEKQRRLKLDIALRFREKASLMLAELGITEKI